ncbi:MAG: DUF4381 domain-containing protein [Chromatiaceae bacterium]|nr:DUF4381 domain-containing protein [Gammaproteobacteria bacterium]MCP5316464.1 DUF4381 domain-containing protein [Chromatiaceae bacterium]MCW5585595.1 DUF4381 domain-containing protein [Chromatiales bacterium]MCP5429420.1 DUF4381 domain-containing protein [Chromatiaceae bacterium]MCP5434229.1 DUF4381 domain-containing protein [Chromatiaceae bacterium]
MNVQPASTTDALQGLRGYHLPEGVSWWPPAPGWWLLLGLLLLVAVMLVWWLLRRRRHQAAARQAIGELKRLRAAHRVQQDNAVFIRGLSRLLRRYALKAFPEQAAALTGEAWLAFLDAHGGNGRFCAGDGRHLADAPYRPTAEFAPDALADLVHDWILRNREVAA